MSAEQQPVAQLQLSPKETLAVSRAQERVLPLNGHTYSPSELEPIINEELLEAGVTPTPERLQELSLATAQGLLASERQRKIEGDLEEYEDFGDNFPSKEPSRVQ